jgi:hypothetical protein
MNVLLEPTDIEIETRTRAEMADIHPTKLRVLGPYEIAALLRQLDRERANSWLVGAKKAEERRAELMPDEHAAVNMLFEATQRLEDLGWQDAIYCPKDGSSFQVIEPGSTGFHRAHYCGEWLKGTWWIEEEADMGPSRPILWKPL